MPKRKNILFVLTDQQRWDSLGAYGASLAHTPVADGLAQRGVVFDSAYTPCTVCSPARASLLCGLYPHQHNVTRNGGVYRRDLPNLAEALLQADYRIGYSGKWHIDNTFGPTHFGFDARDWLGYSYPAGGIYTRFLAGTCLYPVNHYLEYLTGRGIQVPHVEEAVYRPANMNMEIWGRQTGPVEASFEHYVADETIEMIDRFADRGRQDGQPWFVWSNFWGPHDPYILPEPFYSQFRPEDVTLSPSLGETWENKPWIQRMMCTNYWGIEGMSDAFWREALAKYAGYCSLLDWEMGRIIQRLEEKGILDETIIIFSSDHGSMVGHHQLIDKGPYPYEDIQRIPLIVSGPGVNCGERCEEFVYLHDLTPTILDWAGAEAFPCGNGQSLAPLARGGQLARTREDIYTTRHHHPYPYEQRFLRTRRWKYAFNACDRDELYDLDSDPDEMVNLCGDPGYAPVVREMVDRMWEHVVALGDPIQQCLNVWSGRATSFTGMPDGGR